MGKNLFSLFAVAQGCMVLGITIFIFGYYMPKTRIDSKDSMRWHVISVASSYILLTAATIKTAAIGVYSWGDSWYWIITVGYVMGDISLVFVFRAAAKRRRANKIKNEE